MNPGSPSFQRGRRVPPRRAGGSGLSLADRPTVPGRRRRSLPPFPRGSAVDRHRNRRRRAGSGRADDRARAALLAPRGERGSSAGAIIRAGSWSSGAPPPALSGHWGGRGTAAPQRPAVRSTKTAAARADGAACHLRRLRWRRHSWATGERRSRAASDGRRRRCTAGCGSEAD